MIKAGKIITNNDCDFCKGETKFEAIYDEWGKSWWLEGLDGSGSDHLAIWCGTCGPKHRQNRVGFYFEKMMTS